MKKLSTVLFFVTFLTVNSVYSGIKFGEADINRNDEILFTVRQNLPGALSYRSLFYTAIRNGEAAASPEILTCYPEQLELLSGGRILQIRNRYGTALYDSARKIFRWKQTEKTIPLNSMRLAPWSVSPDGRWSCYIEKTNYATGNLVLESTQTGRKIILDPNTAFSYKSVPVKWLSDSSAVVYSKNGNIYFCSPDAVLRGIEVGEEYRKIGPGTINSVSWAGGKYLIYIDGDLIYRINAKELYTIGLYSGIIGKGTAVGRLPSQFIPEKDFFSMNDDLSSMVLVQSGNIFNYYKIRAGGCDYIDVYYSRPYIDRTAALLDVEIMWTDNAAPVIWLRRLPYSGGKTVSSVYKITEKFSQVLDIADSGKPYLSPDGRKCAFYSGSTVYIYDAVEWKRLAELPGENIASIVWSSSSEIYVGGDKTIRRWNILTGNCETVMLSSAVNGYWNGVENGILADAGNGKIYLYDKESRQWAEHGTSVKHTNVVQNGNYRIFCSTTPNLRYENALYVRNLSGKAVTKAVYPESIKKTPTAAKVSLVFDAYDNADGLAQILCEMKLYNVSGTFFLNGEFIRRYPSETKQISVSGNECASMFFTAADLMTKDFIVDEDFIRRGLARNEDEFYRCTGRELALLWHAPYYRASDSMIQAGANAGYYYVNALQKHSDTVTLEQSVINNEKYCPPAQLIDEYMASIKENGGGVIPVSVGISRGSREGYVYDNLDLLISAILDEGFDIVPVRVLLN